MGPFEIFFIFVIFECLAVDFWDVGVREFRGHVLFLTFS